MLGKLLSRWSLGYRLYTLRYLHNTPSTTNFYDIVDCVSAIADIVKVPSINTLGTKSVIMYSADILALQETLTIAISEAERGALGTTINTDPSNKVFATRWLYRTHNKSSDYNAEGQDTHNLFRETMKSLQRILKEHPPRNHKLTNRRMGGVTHDLIRYVELMTGEIIDARKEAGDN